jgi:hypothetical protein
VSGTHDGDPWNFIEASMHAAKKPSLTMLGVYHLMFDASRIQNWIHNFNGF